MPFVAPNFLSRQYRSRVLPSEWVAILYCLGMIVLCVAFRERIPSWHLYAGGHAGILLLTMLMAGAESRAGKFFRAFDMVVYVPAFFFMVCQLVHRVHPVDYDARLIALDRSIGGIGLLGWMRSIETPTLTLLSKLAWISYYFIAFFPGIALYARGARAAPRPGSGRAFEEAKLVLILGWLVSYSAYFALPAQGPAYHEKETGVPQPAWEGPTPALKEAIYALEGEARDTFPSGHVIIAVLVLFLCVRNGTWVAAAGAVPLSLGVIWSTLYLRYHYFVDVLAGAAVAGLCAGFGVWWYRRDAEGKSRP